MTASVRQQTQNPFGRHIVFVHQSDHVTSYLDYVMIALGNRSPDGKASDFRFHPVNLRRLVFAQIGNENPVGCQSCPIRPSSFSPWLINAFLVESFAFFLHGGNDTDNVLTGGKTRLQLA